MTFPATNWRLFFILGALLWAQPALAQKPGYDTRKPGELRAEFMAYLTPFVRDLASQWMEAFEGDEEAVADLYSAEATLTVPGEETRLRGSGSREGGFNEYLGSLMGSVGKLQLGMAEIDGSEEMGLVFGRYDLQGIASPAGQPRDQGHHVTIIVKDGREWVIRSQLFVSTPNGSPSLWWQGEAAQVVPPFEVRGSGSAALASRAYQGMDLAMSQFSQAWHDGDEDAARDLFAENVFFRAPTGEVVSGVEETMALLSGGTVGFGNPLFFSVVDFDHSGTVAFETGRFVLEIPGVPAGLTSGPVMVVLHEDWYDWKIRALVFAPPGA